MKSRISPASPSGVVRLFGMVAVSGLGLLWALEAGDWGAARAAVATARWDLLAYGAAAILITSVVRAARWGELLRPVCGRVSFRARLDATFVGFALNNLLPARAGEIARGVWLGRRGGVPVTVALATIGLERVFDLGAVLLSLAVGVQVIMASGVEGATILALQRALSQGLLLMVAAAGLLAVVLIFRNGLAEHAIRLVPGRYIERGRSVAHLVMNSFGSLRSVRSVAGVVAWTLVLWGCNALAFAAVFRAFDLAASLGLVLVAQSAVALAVALPQAPGGIGVFEASVMAVLVGLGDVSPGAALAATIVLHGIVFLVPVGAAGVVVVASGGRMALRDPMQGGSSMNGMDHTNA